MARENEIEVIARAIAIKKDKILLCKIVGEKWYFLPGGHVEYKEQAAETLIRELKEEGNIEGVQVGNLAGVIENQFPIKDKIHHEINMFFDVKIPDDMDFENQENHIQYEYVSLEDLKDVKLLPNSIKEKISNWRETGKIFWDSIK